MGWTDQDLSMKNPPKKPEQDRALVQGCPGATSAFIPILIRPVRSFWEL